MLFNKIFNLHLFRNWELRLAANIKESNTKVALVPRHYDVERREGFKVAGNTSREGSDIDEDTSMGGGSEPPRSGEGEVGEMGLYTGCTGGAEDCPVEEGGIRTDREPDLFRAGARLMDS